MARIHPALPGEVPREERQDEEAGVARIERLVVLVANLQAEEGRNLDGERRAYGQGQHDEGFDTADRLGRGGVVGTDDELLPQPLGVLARKLARESVEAPHALDGDQERLILCQARLSEGAHMVAQMRFELLDVRRVDGAAPAQVGTPLADLLLERAGGSGAHAVQALSQMRFSVSSTFCHRFRSASSSARPSFVKR